MEHAAFEPGALAGARLKGEARGVREKLHHLLRSLDELVELDQRSEPATVHRIRAILKSRRLRDRFFEPTLFADPAWDILLELYMAELAQYRVAVSSLCIGAAVPVTTALRWIRTLEEKGLVERNPDPTDGRRIYVSLSAQGAQAMKQLFQAVPASELLL